MIRRLTILEAVAHEQQWITVLSGFLGLILLGSLTHLPLVIKLFLGFVLSLALYGTTIVSFRHIRVLMLIGLIGLTLFSMIEVENSLVYGLFLKSTDFNGIVLPALRALGDRLLIQPEVSLLWTVPISFSGNLPSLNSRHSAQLPSF